MSLIKQIQQKKDKAYAIKSTEAKVQDVDMSKRIVTGFYNTFNYFDSDCDVLLPKCATRSINERGPGATAVQKIKHLLHHDWTKLPGKIQVLEERKINGVSGIYYETKMSSTQMGTDTLINYQEGVYDNHSIGFQYLDGKLIEEGAEGWDMALASLLNGDAAKDAGFMFLWSEIKLWEGSTVAFGANALTPYLGVKSDNKDGLALKLSERVDLIVKQLKLGVQSDEAMHEMEMNLLQLKQIQSELFEIEPSAKDTLLQARQEADTNKKGMDWSKLSKSI